MPGNRSSSWATKRRVEFYITDGGSDTFGSKGSKGGGDPPNGYDKMQSRIANRKKERSEKNTTGNTPRLNSNNKKVEKSHEKGSSSDKKTNETRARELTGLLKHALESTKHHEEGDQPRRSDCTALLPPASKIAKVYEPCSKVIK